jgi:hypothetical protein
MDPATIALVRLGVLVGMSGWGIIKDIIAECKSAGLELEDLSVILESVEKHQIKADAVTAEIKKRIAADAE